MRRTGFADAGQLVDRCFEPLRVYGLEHIVQCVHAEGVERVLVVRRHEDHERCVVQRFEQFESRAPRHVDVQEEQVGLLLCDQRLGFVGVGGFAHHFDVVVLLQQGGEFLARQSFVVDDDRFHCAKWLGRVMMHPFVS